MTQVTNTADENNNPGNLRPKDFNYKGQIGTDPKGFAIFKDFDSGLNALKHDIKVKINKGINTPESFIDMYAPAGENNKENKEPNRDNYKLHIASNLGLKSTSEPIKLNQVDKLADLIYKFESGNRNQSVEKAPEGDVSEEKQLNIFEKTEKEIKDLIGSTQTTEQKTDVDNNLSLKDVGVGALAGAGANLLLPPLTDPKLPTKIDTSKAQERALETSDRLELARQNLQSTVPQGSQELEDTFRQSQGNLEYLKNEERLAKERLKGLPKSSASIEPPSLQDEAPSRTKAGDAGAVNWVHSMSDDVPEVVANKALNMRGDNPRGGQSIIDANMAAIQKQNELGLGDFGLTRTEGGAQLALPSTTVAERQADIERQNQESQAELQRKTEQVRVQQEAQARELEQQRLYHENELENLRQQRSQLGQQHNEITSQIKTAAPLQRALTKAETDAEIARRNLARASVQPSALGRTLENVGIKTSKGIGPVGRTIQGGVVGALGVMSYNDALNAYKRGDTSEAVIKALEAGAAGASIVPPIGKRLTRLRGAGAIGGAGLAGFEAWRQYRKTHPAAQ
jgi:hypothetical protein